jgi:glutathione S-transferase
MGEYGKVTVFSGIACPFSHRTRMALTVKGVAFETVEIDLMNPPDWFLAGPARTQMPKLATDDATIYGASVVNEYVDERWKEPPLLPASPAGRAEAREWINWLEVKLQPAYETPLLELDPQRYKELEPALEAVLRELEQKLQGRADSGRWSPGSYWHGERLGMVDLTYAATLLRFAGLRKFHGWQSG